MTEKDNGMAPLEDRLLGDIRQLIEQARSEVATAGNASLTMMYWRIGKRMGRRRTKRASSILLVSRGKSAKTRRAAGSNCV